MTGGWLGGGGLAGWVRNSAGLWGDAMQWPPHGLRCLRGCRVPSNPSGRPVCPPPAAGWALCGHEAPAGFGGSDEEGEGKGGKEEPQQAAAAAQPSSHKRGREEAEQPAPPAPAAPAAAGVAGSAADADMPEAAAPAAAAPDEQQQGGEGGEGQWRPQWALPRERKIAVGQRCKRLIDSARLVWLGRQGFDASLVRYVPSTVSGENRLLVASVR